MLKINSKKKVNKPANTLKPQFTQKKPLVQPEWNATNSDLDRYKLSKAEQVQKKVSFISKHRYEAKELWLQRQDKLKKGIVDEETQSVLETCLSTKRPPEKNMKNLTYFIKDDTYADYLDQAYEESEEKRLSVMDLHPQEKSETKPVKVKEEKPQTRVEKKKQEVDEGDDFIRKVNESLKDARDFMTKIERYPSMSKAKDPERALKALATTSDKEINSRSSSSHAKKKPASISTNSTNLKSSLGSSQNGKKNLNSSSGFKETSPQLPKVEETYKPKYVEEPPKEIEENNNNKEDISTYFKSLNQIEDTIKFLEENIIGGGNSAPEKKEYNYGLPSLPKANERFGFGFDLDDHRSPVSADNKYKAEYSLEKSAEKDEDSYFKKRAASPSHSDIKHHHDEKEELSHDHDDHGDHGDHGDHDDEQISFALTMKSNDQTERNLDHDHYDHHNDHDHKPDYASKLFGFDDMISPVATTLQKPFPIALHSPPQYPQTIFENKAIQERTRTQNMKPQSPPKMETRPQAQPVEEEEEDEEDFNIERIKGLLQATKLEIEKMNTGQLDAYNTSYKTALKDMDKENMSNNRAGFGNNTYNKFDNEYKSDYPMGKKIEVVKNDAFVTVKQPFNAVWENQRRVLADANNTRNMLDDDIPAPQTLDIKKHAVAATYSPKKFDDMPLNFRSFRK